MGQAMGGQMVEEVVGGHVVGPLWGQWGTGIGGVHGGGCEGAGDGGAVGQAVREMGSLPPLICPAPLTYTLVMPAPLYPQASPISLPLSSPSFPLHAVSAPHRLGSLLPLPHLPAAVLLTSALGWQAPSLLQPWAQIMAPAQPCSSDLEPALLLWGWAGTGALCSRLQQKWSLLAQSKDKEECGKAEERLGAVADEGLGV